MLKKTLVIILIITLVFSFAACSGDTSQVSEEPKKNADGKIVVSMWRHQGTPTESNYYDEVIAKFNASQDEIDLQAIALPDATYVEQVNAAILSEDLPDILDLDGPLMAGFVNAGALGTLDEYMNDELKEDLLPSIIEQGTYEDGNIYALGQFESGLSFWANKSLLAEADVRIPTLQNPWDKEEFIKSLDKLKALDSVEYPLDIKVNYGGGYWVYSYLPFVASFGGDYFNRSSFQADGAINSEETISAFNMIKKFVEDGYVNANQSTDDDFYGAKTSALALVGHWMYPPHTSTDALGEDAILIPFPNFGEGVKTGSGSWAWSITSEAKKKGVKDEAWKVIDYLLSDEALMGVFNANGAIPSRISVLDKIDEFKKDGRLYLYREQLEKGHAYVRPITPAFGIIQSAIGEAAINIMKGSDVKSELDKVAKEIDQTVEDNGYHNK